MIVTFHTGNEPNHKVAICVSHVAYLRPNGGMTWIHLANGEKFLVDGTFDSIRDGVRIALEMAND